MTLVMAGCGGPASSPSGTATASPKPSSAPSPTYDARSLPAQFGTAQTGGNLQRVRRIADAGAYTTDEVTFRSGDLTISGVLAVPAGDGPFPAVVLNHGYIDPAVYVNGQGMPRELDYLARQGFVVLHNDYRGHAASDDTDPLDLEFRVGYARDAIAAVKALRKLPQVRDDQVALAGRSMGGAVTFNALVIEPDIVDAAVVWASVSSRYVDNFRQWTEPGRPDRAREIVERWGTPETNPRFWRDLSARTYFERVQAAVMMHHGTNDESCPYPWAEATRDALNAADVDLTFNSYAGERHTFSRDWELSMERTVDFLRSEMDVKSPA